MTTLEIKVYEIFKTKLGDKDAEVVMEYINVKAEEKILQKKDIFLTKDDKVDILRTIYFVGLSQFIAIIVAIIAIINFMLK